MITKEFPPTSAGIGYYVYNLSKKLVERGHRTTVITKGSVSRTRKEIMDGIEVFRVSFFPLYPLHVWVHGAFVNRLVRKLEPKLNLIHLHTPITPSIKTSLPIVTTVHTPMKIDARYHEVFDFFSLAERMQSTMFYPSMESKLFRISKKITAVSWSVAGELKEYGLHPDEITVVGNGVNERIFSPIRNVEQTERYVLYTGVLRARKGLFDLIKCAEYVCKVCPDVRFIICGKGPFLNKLKEEVRRTRLQRFIMFLGYVDRKKLIQTYQKATVHVVPSHYEGLPTVLLEAMSCGLPVVATDVGGNSEVISSGINGFLVPPKAPEEMAKIILRLIDEPLLREKIGRAARKTIEKKYTWDKIADNILQYYENML
ncbi:MAG: glycosyltransferase family 4 protein [Candidatus Hodarchaeota archaeon]